MHIELNYWQGQGKKILEKVRRLRCELEQELKLVRAP
jgi:hypothetical protein